MERFSLMTALSGGYPSRQAGRLCQKHGEYTASEYLNSSGEVFGSFGEQCAECHRERQADEERMEREARIRATMEDAKIPKRFQGCELTSFRPSEGTAAAATAVTDFIERWPEQLKTGESLLLLGAVGTGKTHLAIGVLKHIIRAGSHGRYCTVNELLREIRGTWRGHGGRSEAQMVDYFGGMPLLVLDEAGASNGTDNERVILFDVLNERYERMLPTIVCGNVTVEELAKALDERSVDRLRENGGRAAIMTGTSQRGQA